MEEAQDRGSRWYSTYNEMIRVAREGKVKINSARASSATAGFAAAAADALERIELLLEKKMSNHSILDVKRIKDIDDSTTRVMYGHGKSVNDYLKDGWILLHVYSTPEQSVENPSQIPMYILGWTGEGNPPE